MNNDRLSVGYVTLMASLVSIVAMGTDLMLPALDVIGRTLGVSDPNDAPLVITLFFLGMAAGQILVGPLSDRFGRKPVIQAGYLIFVIGCVVSVFATSWLMMLLGRTLQGFGASAPRIVTVAMIRDQHEGRAMAKVMSIVMALFILVPIMAPVLGQFLVHLAGWHACFVALAVVAAAVSLWFQLAQPETLAVQNRRPLQWAPLYAGFKEVVTTRVVIGYTVAAGFAFGMFIGYLGSAQQIFQVAFGVGDLFVVYFAIAAASIGVSSIVNSRLVMRFGMRKLSLYAIVTVTAVSIVFLIVLIPFNGLPPIGWFVAWQLIAFFCVGIIFGNLNALSLEPLGHMAGMGAAFTGSLSLLISLPLAWLIGQLFDGTVWALVAGFASLSLATWVAMVWTDQ